MLGRLRHKPGGPGQARHRELRAGRFGVGQGALRVKPQPWVRREDILFEW